MVFAQATLTSLTLISKRSDWAATHTDGLLESHLWRVFDKRNHEAKERSVTVDVELLVLVAALMQRRDGAIQVVHSTLR